ncbi:MAG: Betaine aldehyde dehydrogenase [Deltaproteobacteria bacterium]|jgi:betaine-aldehyde dehydrogenase|nr:Betaine aldehyde dehydrogenase [Deltaproteobacteria bacterium]
MSIETLNYIGGKWVSSASGETRDACDPSTGDRLGAAQKSTVADIEDAVSAARQAFDNESWSFAPSVQRAKVLTVISQRLQDNQEYLAQLITRQNGRPIKATRGEISRCIEITEYYTAQARTLSGRINQSDPNVASLIVREPVGVCGLITPWNFPLDLAMRKIAPALATGCTIVLKPACLTAIVSMEFIKLFDDVPGLPQGVVNAVSGTGSILGNALVQSPQVDKISFTGSTDTAKAILTTAADTMKRVSLEAGGKSPNIIFADAPMEAALSNAITGAFANSGQSCTAKSRLLVQESIQADFVTELVKRTGQLRVGLGLKEDVDLGPIASKTQLETVMSFIQAGLEEGGEKVVGGQRLMDGEYKRGFFVEPTIFQYVTNEMQLGKHEIFGPVLSVMPFTDEPEAIALANETHYGLSSAIFTNDVKRAFRVAQRLRAGEVTVNSQKIRLAEAPFGGYKQSGLGRELGVEGLEAYQEIKHIAFDLA